MNQTTFSTTRLVTSGKANLLALCLLAFVLCAGSVRAQKPSDYAGRYSGEWIASMGLDEDHNGTWNITIAGDGDISGTEYDKTTGQKASLSGFIDGDGYVDLFLKYTEKTYKVKGTLTKRGTRLTGVLKQYAGTRLVANVDITLKRE